MALKIKKGDNVVILSGKDKGKNGKVLKIVRLKSDSRIKVVVEGVNIVKKHTKQSATSNFIPLQNPRRSHGCRSRGYGLHRVVPRKGQESPCEE